MCNDKFYNDVDTKSINKRLGIVRSWLLGNRSDFIVFSNSLVASFPSLPRFFCSSVCIDNNTRMDTEGRRKTWKVWYYVSRALRQVDVGGGVAQPQITLNTADEVV